jgi:acyl dehydratase
MAYAVNMMTDTTTTAATQLIAEGETFSRRVSYTREDIAAFARETGDANPLHHDLAAAKRARHGDIIACGQHTAARMMGSVATHFSRADDGLEREMLCLNFNFSLKAPVFAGDALNLVWTVTHVSPNAKLGGLVGELSGEARRDDASLCVVGRCTVLVKHFSTG